MLGLGVGLVLGLMVRPPDWQRRAGVLLIALMPIPAIWFGALVVESWATGPSASGLPLLQMMAISGLVVALLILVMAGGGLMRRAPWAFRVLVVGAVAMAAGMLLLLLSVQTVPLAILSFGPLLLAGCTARAVRDEHRTQAAGVA